MSGYSDETKEILETLFGDQVSILKRRYDVFRLHIGDRSYNQLASTINRMHSLAKTQHMAKEQFECLSFVSALKEEKHVEMKTRLLRKLEVQEDCTLADLVRECNLTTTLSSDAEIIDENLQVANAVRQGKEQKKVKQDFPSKEFQ